MGEATESESDIAASVGEAPRHCRRGEPAFGLFDHRSERGCGGKLPAN